MASVRVFILPEGKIQIFVDEGTEEEAQEATRKVLGKLKVAGINFESIGEIELHRTGASHAHIVNEVHQHEQQ